MDDERFRRPVFLRSIEYEIGELTAITNEGVQIPADVKDRLLGLGYRKFSRYPGLIDDLACAPIKKMFASDPNHIDKIDAIIVAQQQRSFNIISYMRAAGVKDVPVIELGGMDCANLAASICYAHALVSNSIYNNVLCCFATNMVDMEERVLANGDALCGDGAACCLVSSDEGKVRLRDFEQSTNFEIYDTGPSPNHPKTYFSFCRAVFNQLMNRRGGTPFDHMIPANFPLVTNLFSKLVGPSCGAPFLENVERLAHVGTGDALINLKDFYDRGGRGDILIVGIGPYTVCMIDAVAL